MKSKSERVNRTLDSRLAIIESLEVALKGACDRVVPTHFLLSVVKARVVPNSGFGALWISEDRKVGVCDNLRVMVRNLVQHKWEIGIRPVAAFLGSIR